MNELRELLSNDFLPKFLAGMVVNFEIAAIALVIGLALVDPARYQGAARDLIHHLVLAAGADGSWSGHTTQPTA